MFSNEVHQAMLERDRMLVEALERAESGLATHDDWALIRFQCGVPRRATLTLETISIGANDESSSE